MDDELAAALPGFEADVNDTADTDVTDSEAKALRQFAKREARYQRPVKKRAHHRGHQQPSTAIAESPTAISDSSTSKTARSGLFAEWLVRTYGATFLTGHTDQPSPPSNRTSTNIDIPHYRRFSCHSLFLYPRALSSAQQSLIGARSVVDVAGGRGHLSFLLAAVYGVRCAVVDPRRLDIHRWQRQYRQRVMKMTERLSKRSENVSGGDGGGGGGGGESPVLVPVSDRCARIQHFRCNFPQSVPTTQQTSNYQRQDQHHQQLSAADSDNHDRNENASVEFVSESPIIYNFHAIDDSETDDRDAANRSLLAQSLTDCSLLVGLHSDGATESIVDFALAHNKCFAVVPCCVCGSHSHSDTGGGSGSDDGRSMQYTEYVDYLQSKHPTILRTALPFAGRNIVLYRMTTR